MTDSTDIQAQKGGALIYVLWVSMILSSLLVGAISASRLELHTARSQIERFKLSVAIQSVSELMAFQASTKPGFLAEINDNIGFSQAGYTFTVEPYASYSPMNINNATEQELSNFFTIFGKGVQQANILAAQVADWRDADSLRRPNGAEEADYANTEIFKSIKNRPFLSINEIYQVKDIDTAFFECIRPAISVVSSTTEPGEKLLEALYGIDQNRTPQAFTAKIGTSNNVPKGGDIIGFRISAFKIEMPKIKATQISIHRYIGKPTQPYELVARYIEKNNGPAQYACTASA